MRPGDQVDPVELVEQLVMLGYRREGQVEHRGEVAVRGSIVDVYPSTADAPVRIDLWGDEVERLTEFAVADQRSTEPVESARIYPCREFRPTEARQARAAELVAEEPWGREQWDRFADGTLFDGMESWLPWLVEGEHLITDLIGADGLVAFVEPRRLRDRAAEILAEEADLASTLALTWDVAADDVHRLHLDFDRLMTRTGAASWSILATPDKPTTPVVAASGWEPVVGDLSPTISQIRSLLDDGYRVVVAADGEASANRLGTLMAEHDVVLDIRSGPTRGGEARPAGEVIVAPIERGVILADIKLAVIAESDVTGRRRTHRQARRRRRDTQRFSRICEKAALSSITSTASPGSAAWSPVRSVATSATICCSNRGGDKLYVPSDQIESVRHYTGGDTPSLSRMGGSDWSQTKAKVRSAVQEIAQELVVLYQKRARAAATPLRPTHPGRASSRRRSRSRKPPTNSTRSST